MLEGPASSGWVVIVVVSISESVNLVILDWSPLLSTKTVLQVCMFLFTLVKEDHCLSLSKSECTHIIAPLLVKIEESSFYFKLCRSWLIVTISPTHMGIALAEISKEPTITVAIFA